MGIGKLRCHVFHVTDLELGQAFWSAVTGLAPIPSVFPGRAAYLGTADPWNHEVILWKVDTEKDTETNRSHVDIWVRDVDRAIDQIVEVGGRLKRPPTIYPRPRSRPGEPARLDWSVMQDPFGNEFCVISMLSPDEADAVAAAGEAADAAAVDDDHWREAAGRARRSWWAADGSQATDLSPDDSSKEHHHEHAH